MVGKRREVILRMGVVIKKLSKKGDIYSERSNAFVFGIVFRNV
jgi:hypothetical protein